MKPCHHDYTNPIRKGRASYACPKCGADISLALFLMWTAEHEGVTMPDNIVPDCVG